MRDFDVKFDFDDILLEPERSTTIKSRYNDIDPMYSRFNGKHVQQHYPVFTAPMDSVVDLNNMREYMGNYIPVVLPRTVTYDDYLNFIQDSELDRIRGNDRYVPELFPDFTFMSFSLKKFKSIYSESTIKYGTPVPKYALIDTANGHLTEIKDVIEEAISVAPDTVIMVGNIANPRTYEWYAEERGLVDFIRIGIGNGNGCLTTQQTGIGFPKASLIAECAKIKGELEYSGIQAPKIVADGGMKDYSDIIKALALGADYVMAGSLFNKALESAGENYLYKFKISPKLAEKLYHKDFPVKKKFYGMSTKVAQKKLGTPDHKLKTSEGVVRFREIEYTLSQWVDNFDHYLRSAMSYSDARMLKDFIGSVNYNLISENAFNRFKK